MTYTIATAASSRDQRSVRRLQGIQYLRAIYWGEYQARYDNIYAELKFYKSNAFSPHAFGSYFARLNH